MQAKKSYVQVGVGGRARFFYEALATTYRETSELRAFCDTNHTRMEVANRSLVEDCQHPELPLYAAEDFDRMIAEQKPDIVIVTSVDRTHHRYIVRAMELGCDVITEKPMTTDIPKLEAILDAIERTGRKLRVTFNYRYSPHNSKVRELIMQDTIGQVHSIHFEWLLNTQHGADYFRRWHRDKRNSGGLLVHKSTHHFDLVNFWLDTLPETVFAMGDLKFYGRENAEERGIHSFYNRSHGSPQAQDDPFAIDMAANPQLKALYLDAEHEDGYLRDQSVFGDGISIEDTMAVMVRYQSGTLMTYSLNAYLPWEGFRIAFNGDKGRIQLHVTEKSYINSGGDLAAEGATLGKSLTVFPMHAEPYDVPIIEAEGGHGGGDPILLNDLFGEPTEDPLDRAASYADGATSILTGIAANESICTGLPVRIRDLVDLKRLEL